MENMNKCLNIQKLLQEQHFQETYNYIKPKDTEMQKRKWNDCIFL